MVLRKLWNNGTVGAIPIFRNSYSAAEKLHLPSCNSADFVLQYYQSISSMQVISLIKNHTIAGYCRISVDEELDRDNVSIENHKSIITNFVKQKFRA